MKSAQVGLTERMITEAMWLPDQFNYNSIYLFPTTGTIGDLVQERIDQPINVSPYLSAVSGRAKVTEGKHADKIGLKKMTKGFVYFRGSNALTAITSVAGDIIFVDELDRMVQENVPYFDKRLEHSYLKHQRWASTPTYTNFGIHKRFLKTDQMEYHVICNHCQEKQILDFFINVDIEKKRIICRACKETIIPWKLEGEWIPKNPEAKKRGYHVSQLYSPRLSLDKLIEAYEADDEFSVQQFYNQNLGLPYEPRGDKITATDIENCKGEHHFSTNSTEETFMGVDVGKRLHYIIRTLDGRILSFGSVSDFLGPFNSLESLVENFNVRGMVIDALPETRKVTELINKFPNKVKMCYYAGLIEIKDSNKYWNVDNDKVNTNRTVSLDNMVADFKKKRVKVPIDYNRDPEFLAHLQAPIRVVKEDNRGNKKAEYVETSEDHLFHAMNYARLAVKVFDVATPDIFVL